MGEQRYKAVMAVLSGGRTVTEVARDWEVSRQTMHAWLARYELQGMEGMGDRSHRPTRCPHQMPALVEVRVLKMRRHKPFWGPHRLVLELGKKGVTPTPSASAIYRCLLRAGMIQPTPMRWRREDWKRWERGIAGTDRFTIARRFRWAFGTSPDRYRMLRRLALARAPIESGQSLAQAAAGAGFADQSHMTRQFERT